MTHASRLATLAAVLAVTAAGCKLDTTPPRIGPPAGQAPPPAGLVVEIVAAGVQVDGHAWAELVVTKDDLPLDGAALAELRPAFTLAGLGVEPVSGLPAWRSYLPLGPQGIARLPVAGPGTPDAQVLLGVRQPGAEEAHPQDLGDGRFRHVFETALPVGFSAAETLRVGVFMEAVTMNPRATSTFDFVPSGGAPASRELVLDADCASCHDTARGHEGTRMGWRICVTCHTWQNADPDTVDPAAAMAATPLTDPNPLEFGRLVHRIHRGRYLPTLYTASSAAPAPALPSSVALPLPFAQGRNALLAGRKFSIVGEGAVEHVYGEARTRSDNGATPRLVAGGLWFPRTYRECDACHAGAAQWPGAYTNEISRRSCHGCHPDVWFEPFAGALDAVHLAHPGGPQTDDTRCAECHVRSGANPDPLAPLDEVHVAPLDRLKASQPSLEIVALRDFQPGKFPIVVFKVRDRNGVLTSLDAPVPATDQGPNPSPVRRAMYTTGTNSTVSMVIGGPAAGGGAEYAFRSIGGVTYPISQTVPVATLADAEGNFTHTSTVAIPDWATGTWAVLLSGRRTVATTHYDLATKRFSWPYSGETVAETADQVIAYVDTAVGTWSAGEPVPETARRLVVEQALCERCHRRLAFHGGTRNLVQGCLLCHTPDRSDWSKRPKNLAGDVNLAATYDGLEEQSIHFKVMIERIHTGTRHGSSATVEQFSPYVIYGGGGTGSPFFFGDGTFPADLARCDRCHADGTWRIDALPADAGATVANEKATVRHAGTIGHENDPAIGPMQASCTSCHANAFATEHAARNTVGGKETCLSCHGANGQKASDKVHGLR
jgi:OmcA/MtrC family decaheme c-type cytochrome